MPNIGIYRRRGILYLIDTTGRIETLKLNTRVRRNFMYVIRIPERCLWVILMVRERKSRRKSFIYLLWLFNSNEFINHSTEIGVCLVVVVTSCFCNFRCCLCFTARDIVVWRWLNEMIANWLYRYFIAVVKTNEMVLIAEGGLYFETLRCGMCDFMCLFDDKLYQQQSRIYSYWCI